MKNVRFLILSLNIAVCLCLNLNVKAQTDDKLPKPFLDVVSVDPETGEITIEWIFEPAPGAPAVDYFELQFYESDGHAGGFYPFATVPITQRIFKFKYENLPVMNPNHVMLNPKDTTVVFAIRAVQLTATEPNKSVIVNRHRNMLLTSKYDSCKSEIRLEWYTYNGKVNGLDVGWLNNWPLNRTWETLESYHVMQSVNGGPYEKIKTLMQNEITGDINQIQYVVPRVDDNKTYKFYISAKRSDGKTATSYKTELFTKVPRPPSFITAVETDNSDGYAKVSFELDPNAETYSYRFLGSNLENASVKLLDTIVNTGSRNITLTDIQKRERTYYYKLEARYICDLRPPPTSNIATALWLKVKQEGTDNLLSWDPYIAWEDGQNQKIDAQYVVFRKNGNDIEEIVTISDPETTAFTDDLAGVLIKGELCYWILATPERPNLTDARKAISNTVCFEPESEIWIPQAFTPNGDDDINRKFKPFFSYPPKDYTFIAYDRTGAKVFETKDVNEGWNGQLINGKPANEGVYTYLLKFRTEMGRLVEKKGTFVLLLP